MPIAGWRRRSRWRSERPTDPNGIPATIGAESARRVWGGLGSGWCGSNEAIPWEVRRRVAEEAELASVGRLRGPGGMICSVQNRDGTFRWHEDTATGAVFSSEDYYFDSRRVITAAKGSDIKVPWELSEFGHVRAWVLDGPRKRSPLFLAQWNDWMEKNPLARGVNWACTMKVAVRAINWSLGMACWWDEWDVSTRRKFWAAMYDHGRFIRDNLEWSPTDRYNHYFGDIVGLAVVAATIGNHQEAEEWGAFAAREIAREILGQFAPDGLNREQSTAYHRLMVELATIGVRACEVLNRPVPAACRDRLAAAYRAMRVLGGETGQMPLVGDNDSASVLRVLPREDGETSYLWAIGARLLPEQALDSGPVSPEYLLLFPPPNVMPGTPVAQPAKVSLVGQALADSGFFVLGDSRNRMILRCGPLTYRPVGAHRHMDQLSFSLWVDGFELLVDPGQFCYSAWPERGMRYRKSSAHNTVEVDGLPQSWAYQPPGGYCYTLFGDPRPRCERFQVDSGHATFVGVHSGYRRLRRGGDHRRICEFDATRLTWEVRDEVNCAADEGYRWYFHVHPAAVITEIAQGWRIERGSVGLELAWQRPSMVRSVILDGAYAPRYGIEHRASTLVVFQPAASSAVAEFQLKAVTLQDQP